MDDKPFQPVAILPGGMSVPLEMLGAQGPAQGPGKSAEYDLRRLVASLRQTIVGVRSGQVLSIERNRYFWNGSVDEPSGLPNDHAEWRGGRIPANHLFGVSRVVEGTTRKGRVEHKPGLVRREGKATIGILGKPPVVNAESVEQGDDEGANAAATAQRAMNALLAVVDRETIALNMVKAMFVEGTVFVRSRVIPSRGGGAVSWKVDMHTSFDVTVPYAKRSLEECPWMIVDVDLPFPTVMDEYPEARHQEIMRMSSYSGGMEIDVRTTANSVRYLNRDVRISTLHVQPSWYWELVNPARGMSNDALANLLAMAYPTGMSVTMVNHRVIRIEACDMLAEWTAINPDNFEYLQAVAMCDPAVRAERLIAGAWNDIARTLRNGTPLRFYNSATMDANTLRNAVSGDRTDFLGVPGNPREHVHEMAPASINEAAAMILREADDAVKQVMGTTAPIMGLGTGQRQGYAESMANMMQAMQPHFPVWSQIRAGWKGIVEKGIASLARALAASPVPPPQAIGPDGAPVFDMEGNPVPAGPPTQYTTALRGSDGKTVQVKVGAGELANLQSGAWTLKVAEMIPMSEGMRRAELTNMFVTAPQIADMVIGASPKNVLAVQRLLGIHGIDPPFKAKYEYAMGMINDLAKGVPLDVPNLMGGPPLESPQMPDGSAVVAHPEFEDTAFIVAVLRDWFMDEDAKRIQYSDGWRNVHAYYMMQKDIADQQAMAMMQQQGPPPGDMEGQGPPPPGPPQDQQIPAPVM